MMARPSSQHSASFFLARCSLRGARWRHGGGRSHLRGVLRVPTLGGRRCVPVARRHRGRPRAHALLRPRGGRDDCGLRPMRRDNLLARSRRGGSLPEVQSLRHRRARARPRPTATPRRRQPRQRARHVRHVPTTARTHPTRSSLRKSVRRVRDGRETPAALRVREMRRRAENPTPYVALPTHAERVRRRHVGVPRRVRRLHHVASTSGRRAARAAGGRARRMGRAR